MDALRKLASDYDPYVASSGLLSALAGGAYVAMNGGINQFNPLGRKSVAVVGGIKQWNPVARSMAAKLLKAVSSGDVPPKLVEKTRAALILANPGDKTIAKDSLAQLLDKARGVFQMDSFSGQALSAADSLHRGGFNVDVLQKAVNSPMRKVFVDSAGNVVHKGTSGAKELTVFNQRDAYRPIDLSPSSLRKADAVLQVGDGASDHVLNNARTRGKGVYRLLTDYGDGNFKQPDMWLDGQNWMKVRNPRLYDRLFVPGGAEKGLWSELKRGRKANVNIGDIAISPIFEDMQFSNSGGKPKAMLTVGGGAGSSIALRNVGASESQRYNFIGKERTLFDDILSALRKKHGDKAILDVFLGGTITKPQPVLRGGKVFFERPPSDASLSRNLQKLTDLLDPTSKRYKKYKKLERGRKLISAIEKRYKGLNFIHRVPQTEIGKAYATSDYVFALPGSTTAEFSAIKGQKHGGLIHLIPSEADWAPRHFRGNAKYVNRMMQPLAKDNIVSLVGKTRADDLVKAVAEGGFKDWGRINNHVSKVDSLKPMVSAIKRDIALKRLGRAGKLGVIAAPAIGAGAYFMNKLMNRNSKPKSDSAIVNAIENVKFKLFS